MSTSTTSSSDPARNVRELCFAADWACSEGDLGTLHYVTKRLAVLEPEPFRGQLLALAAMCRQDPARAASAWFRLKPLLVG